MSQRIAKINSSGSSTWPAVIVLTKADMVLQPMENQTTVVSMSPLKRSCQLSVR